MNDIMIRNKLSSLAFWSNPVVARDLRVQLRGAKSYWFQGVYLLLLGILALAGYAMTTQSSNGEVNVVAMSYQLQAFYYFIYITLAALIVLIAPALTAASITTERQRLTLDLLTTTPMTASELLIGKLLSSTAFLSLLLVLSVPASALCIILGGATITDLLKVYLLIALDGLVLASIGLYFSATTRTSVQSIVWTYAATVVYVGLTLFTTAGSGILSGMGRGAGLHANGLAAVAALNPFGAVMLGSYTCDLLVPWGTLSLPVWIPSAVIAVLFIRLLVTAAIYRMGLYGGNPAGSLRLQVMFIILLAGVCIGSALPASTWSTSSGSTSTVSYGEIAVLLFAGAFALLLPALFVPVAPQDSLPGTAVRGRFDLRKLLRPDHSSSLPLFTICLAVGVAAIFFSEPGLTFHAHYKSAPHVIGPGHPPSAGSISSSKHVLSSAATLTGLEKLDLRLFASIASDDRGMILLTALYVWCFGFFMWSVARRTGSWLKDTSAARALAFAVTTAIAVLPCAWLGFSDLSWDKNPYQYLWVFQPLLHLGPDQPEYVMSGAALCLALGILIYPFWRDVIPGGKPRPAAKPKASRSLSPDNSGRAL